MITKKAEENGTQLRRSGAEKYKTVSHVAYPSTLKAKFSLVVIVTKPLSRINHSKRFILFEYLQN